MSEIVNSGTSSADESQVVLTEKAFFFHGSGFEYFKIWIMNIFLTIVTLGIYSAWALVRNRRYFYGNTEVMGARFEYHAKPLGILIGRIIAIVLLVLFSLSAAIPILNGILILVLYAALPWIINKSLRFNAYNSSYRNIRFNFEGTYWKALMAFVVWPFLAIITVFILLPVATKKQQEYIANNSLYGKTHFAIKLPLGKLYKITLITIAITVGTALLAFMLTKQIDFSEILLYSETNEDMGAEYISIMAAIYTGLLAFYIGMIVSYFYYFVAITNLVYNHMQLAGNEFKSTMTVKSYMGLVLLNLLLLVVTLGFAIPWLKVRNARYAANKLALMSDGKADEFVQAEARDISSLGDQLGDVLELGI